MLLIILSNLCLSVVYFLVQLLADKSLISVANQIGPIVLLIFCLLGAYKSFVGMRFSLFTPLPWFYFAYGIYFGFAPLIYHFGSPESIEYCDYFYPVNELALLRTNLLNSTGIALVLFGYKFARLLFLGGGALLAAPFKPIRLLRICLVFIIAGLLMKFLFSFPYYMGWISWTLPGFINSLSALSRIAIVLLFILVYEGAPRLRWLLYAIVTEELIVALMTLSKLAVIEVIIAVGLGWIVTRQPNLKKLIASGVVLALLYIFILSPFVTYSRILSGTVGVGSIAEIIQSISTYATTTDRDDLNKAAGITLGVQGWWTRLVYTNAQTFAMVDYEEGRGGETIVLALHAFTPRLLYADKPIMTPGRDFTAVIKGVDSETATSAGVMAEAYWNGGWSLVAFIGLFLGVIFRAFSIFAIKKMTSKQFEYLPIMFVGISQGYSICDWFASAYVGPLANVIVFFVLIKYVVTPLIRESKKSDNFI